jgi:hypothetical protein
LPAAAGSVAGFDNLDGVPVKKSYTEIKGVVACAIDRYLPSSLHAAP